MLDLRLSIYDNWSARRISLKHHWFDRLSNIVRAAAGTDTIPAHVSDWPTKYEELRRWLLEAEAALSPSQVLDLDVFRAWPEDFRREYKDILHGHFLARWGSHLTQCNELLDQVNTRLSPFAQGSMPWRNAPVAELADLLGQAAHRLSALPDRVEWAEEVASRLPVVLVVDDELGRDNQAAQDLRRAFCHTFHLSDAQRPENSVRGHSIAEAYFCPGQSYDPSRGFINDLSVVEKWVEQGPPPHGEPLRWALILVDIRFLIGTPDQPLKLTSTQFGLEVVIPWLKSMYAELPAVVVTSEKREETITAVRNAGVAYLSREHGTSADLLYHIVHGDRASSDQLRAAMRIPETLAAYDPTMLRVLFEAWKAAQDPQQLSVLLLGETGAGKERLAKFIHEKSPRNDGPFEPINCAKFTKELADSQLFGFYKGAFDLAKEDTPGHFHKAHGGTIQLDEFGDLAEEAQAKLLRTLDPRRPFARPVEPVGRPQRGSQLQTSVDVRVICSTNKSLTEVRNDLRRRLPVTIIIPPLRERRGDIIPLVRYFLSSPERLNAPGITLSADACSYLQSLDLLGNTRELEEILSKALVGKGTRNILTRQDLEAAYLKVHVAWSGSGSPTAEGPAEKSEIPLLRTTTQAFSPPTDLPAAIALVLNSCSDWDNLTKADIDRIDKYLRGEIGNIFATLLKWALFRSGTQPDAPSVAAYLSGTETKAKSRLPQDIICRFLTPDGVAQKVLESPQWPKSRAFNTISDRVRKPKGRRNNKPTG